MSCSPVTVFLSRPHPEDGKPPAPAAPDTPVLVQTHLRPPILCQSIRLSPLKSSLHWGGPCVRVMLSVFGPFLQGLCPVSSEKSPTLLRYG